MLYFCMSSCVCVTGTLKTIGVTSSWHNHIGAVDSLILLTCLRLVLNCCNGASIQFQSILCPGLKRLSLLCHSLCGGVNNASLENQ
jgi:hypothetical protein